MLIGIPKESLANEARVAATPKTVEQLLKLGFTVNVERNAGLLARFNDQDYVNAGATLVSNNEIWNCDLILKVNAPNNAEIQKMQSGCALISFIWPAQNKDLLDALSAKKITTIAMDAIPRLSRAQSMDALSSMANIAGYRAIIEASHEYGRFLSGQITAAGKIPPAKVLVIGAGVAGLAAIGTAGSLGAIVRAFDTRPEVKEQVESLGGAFLTIELEEDAGSGDGYAKTMSPEYIAAEMALFAEQAKDVDIIVTTALIPGKPAPKLITADMVASMQSGSVIVDLAAQTGGNCDLTVADQLIETENHVKIIGYTDLPSRLPTQSSQLYSTNIVNLLKLLCKEKNGELDIDFNDDIIRTATVVKENEITWPAPPIKVSAQPQAAKAQVKPQEAVKPKAKIPYLKQILLVVAILLCLFVSRYLPSEFLSHFTVFALACVVGYYVVWNVKHALHTPLMSVTNAISGIIIVGALLQIGSSGFIVPLLSFIAILVASINIFGGFTVTHRMLNMFRKH